ncbi:MAG TPA: division/cell wall cluster transcriptional repressor MraZ [Thermoanaerobaculia bacterium]|jgi:MraZ protein|nr:division/cell wall cluster transcriptional repressor MraZ [Thermoanaerobaculia bacterium]
MDRFRGSAPARVDEKGRLKVPSLFRAQIDDAFGPELFVTSVHGRNVLLYPLAIWRALEEKLAALPAVHRAKNKFLERVNYYGQDASLDGQGRVLIPQILRDAVKLPADVVVTGNIDHLVVSDRGALEGRLTTEDFTDEDYDELSKALS